MNLDGAVPNDDPFDNGFHDLLAFVERQRGPAGVEVPGLGQDLVLGEELDASEIDLALERGEFLLDLLEALFERTILPAKALDRYLVANVGLVDSIHFPGDAIPLGGQGSEGLVLGLDLLIGPFEVGGDLLGGEDESFQLLREDRFEILDRNLVVACLTAVFRRLREDIHLLAAGADDSAREEVHGLLRRALTVLTALAEDPVDLGPEVF